jgi:hypothetical protein
LGYEKRGISLSLLAFGESKRLDFAPGVWRISHVAGEKGNKGLRSWVVSHDSSQSRRDSFDNVGVVDCTDCRESRSEKKEILLAFEEDRFTELSCARGGSDLLLFKTQVHTYFGSVACKLRQAVLQCFSFYVLKVCSKSTRVLYYL